MTIEEDRAAYAIIGKRREVDQQAPQQITEHAAPTRPHYQKNNPRYPSSAIDNLSNIVLGRKRR